MNDNESWSDIEGEARGKDDGVTYDPESEEPLTESIVTAVSAVSKFDRLELQPLYAVVDPEALDALFQPTPFGTDRREGRVVFDYGGCEVTVHSCGPIEVQPLSKERVKADD